MVCGMKAQPATESGMKASAVHSAGRHRGDSSFPSGKTRGRTRPIRPVAGAKIQVFDQSAAVPNGSEPGECTTVYLAYAKGAWLSASTSPIRQNSGPIGWPGRRASSTHPDHAKASACTTRNREISRPATATAPDANVTIVATAAAAQPSPADVGHLARTASTGRS